jgi:hypothetical protein
LWGTIAAHWLCIELLGLKFQWPLPIGKVVRLIVTMAAVRAAAGGEEVTMSCFCVFLCATILIVLCRRQRMRSLL